MKNNNIDYSSCNNLRSLVDLCHSFYSKNRDTLNKKNIIEQREQLSLHIEKFHKASATLTPSVIEKITKIREESPIILMTAHQPNLFPYSGVLRKATLLYVLQNELEKRYNDSVVSFYGIADQDFTDDRWVKSSNLSSITRREGLLTLGINLPEKVILKSILKPTKTTIDVWKDEVKTWMLDSAKSFRHLYNKNGTDNWNPKISHLISNFKLFWKIIEEAELESSTYADFNSFIMSKIVNKEWQYDTLFSRFSDCQSIFSNEFNYLLKHFDTYSNTLKESTSQRSQIEDSKGVSKAEYQYLPFWYHCECGGKTRLAPYIRDESIIGRGYCIKCNKEYEIELGKKNNPDVSAVSSNISAPAIPMILIFSMGLGLSCYIGGVRGKEYLNEAKQVAEKLDIKSPIINYWRPHDLYLSTSNLEALMEYKRIIGNYNIYEFEKEIKKLESKIEKINKNINHLQIKKEEVLNHKKINDIENDTTYVCIRKISKEINDIRKNSNITVHKNNLKELKNIPKMFMNVPSIIDYAINIGLKETSDQWVNYLTNNNSLSSNVDMKSLFDDLNSEHKSIIENLNKSLIKPEIEEKIIKS